MSRKNAKRGVRTAFFTLLFIGLFYVLLVESSIMMLGINDIVNYNDSLIVAIRVMSLSFLDFLERFDVLFLTVGFMGMYMGISVAITAMVEYICKIFKNVKRLTIVIFLGIAIYILIIIASTMIGFETFVTEAGIILGIISAIIIPGVLLIIAKARKFET